MGGMILGPPAEWSEFERGETKGTDTVPIATIVVGAVLTLLGVVGYFASGRASVTALIPAFFGGPLLVLGVLALREGLRAPTLYAAAGLAVLGLLGTAPGVVKFFKLMGGEDVVRPQAVKVQAFMALVCAAYVVAAVISFVRGRGAS
jgi:hypothetical protein